VADYGKALELAPVHAPYMLALYKNELAGLLVTCPAAKLRNPARAVELARTSVQLAPQNGNYWNTLGVAHYRAGDWKPAVAAFNKSMELRKGGDACDWFFLAMAHQKLGKHDEARKWYNQGDQWLEKNKKTLAKEPQHAQELRRFRSEAAALLGIKK
jgi:tetratricopeptide (TPR) repeat protein